MLLLSSVFQIIPKPESTLFLFQFESSQIQVNKGSKGLQILCCSHLQKKFVRKVSRGFFQEIKTKNIIHGTNEGRWSMAKTSNGGILEFPSEEGCTNLVVGMSKSVVDLYPDKEIGLRGFETSQLRSAITERRRCFPEFFTRESFTKIMLGVSGEEFGGRGGKRIEFTKISTSMISGNGPAKKKLFF